MVSALQKEAGADLRCTERGNETQNREYKP